MTLCPALRKETFDATLREIFIEYFLDDEINANKWINVFTETFSQFNKTMFELESMKILLCLSDACGWFSSN